MKKQLFFIQGGAQDGKFLQRTKVKKPGMINNGIEKNINLYKL